MYKLYERRGNNNMSNVVDLFKNKNEMRAKAEYKHDFFRGNVYSRNFVKNTYTAVSNDFAAIVKSDGIKEARLSDSNNKIVNFPVEANNRVEYFYTPTGKRVNYSEITKVEKIEPSEYAGDATNSLKKLGFTEFYSLKKMNEFNVEVDLCVMAILRA